jgi:hypothetical protein
MHDSSSFLDSLRLAYVLREAHRSPYEEIHRTRIQDLVEKTTRYTFFEDEKTERIEREIERTDRDASIEGRVTNQEIASLRRAGAIGRTVDSVLPGLYPGGFDFSEEFSRSMDGRKGPFFENVITYSDPRQVLGSGRELKTLLQYLVAPQRAWYANKATPEYDPDDAEPAVADQDVLYRAFSEFPLDFSDVSESGRQHEKRKSDGVVVTDRPDLSDEDEDSRILIFSEHRSSVTTGGQTARASLFDKLEALIDVLSSNESVVSIPSTDELTPAVTDEAIRLPAEFAFDTTYTFAELLDAFGINHIYIYVGALFNEGRGIATVTDDATEGRLSEYGNQVNSFKDQCRRMSLPYEQVGDEAPDLDITVPAPNGIGETQLHLRFTYGDEHVDAVYNGPPPESHAEATEYTRTTMADVFEPINVDDLWLNYSVSQRERQATSILQHQVDNTLYENNATQLARAALDDDSARAVYAKLHHVFYSDSPAENRLTTILAEAAETLAETYVSAAAPDEWPSHESQLQAVYPDDPPRAARYVALHVLTYDLLVQPLFTKRKVLPKAERDRLDASPKLESARKGLASYVFQPVDTYARPNRAAVFRTIREHTTYTGPPSNPDTTVTAKLSKQDPVTADLHGSILSRLKREDVIASETTAKQEYYYIPREVAAYTDKYLGIGDD